MVAQTSAPTPAPEPPAGDGRVVLHGISWELYQQLLESARDRSGVRMTYLQGDLEIMSPGTAHESHKTMIGRLLEAYSEEREIDLNGYGSTTVKERMKQRGLEPDECYTLRLLTEDEELGRPELAIEVVESRWLIDKLAVYAGLGVPEVWLWRRGALEVHVLEGESYLHRERSALLPELDLALLASFVPRRDQRQAVKEFRLALQDKNG